MDTGSFQIMWIFQLRLVLLGGFLKETKVIGGVESLGSLKKESIISTEESGNKSNKAVFTEPSAGNGILKNVEAVKAFGNTGKLSDRSTHRKIKSR